MAVEYRTATATDADALATFAISVFQETFGPHNTAANMQQYLETSLTSESIAAQLTRSLGGTILGTDAGNIMAYAMMLPDEPRPNDAIPSDSLFLQRFYLHSKLHGTGAADALLNLCVDHANAVARHSLWLTVWEHNPRAIRFYEKRQFEPIGDFPFQFGDELQRDIVMLRRG